jgi:predicted nucleic acid-binding protein
MMVYLDANCVVYLVEANPTWGPRIAARLASERAAGNEIATSDLSRTECLIGPLINRDAALLADYHTFFTSAAVKMLPLTAGVCERAAEIRAASSSTLKVPDCLHLAAGVEHGCVLFLTNDRQLLRCGSIRVELL